MKKSLYAQYIEEREGGFMVEHDWGFATCKKLGDDFYLEDIYVVPEHRDTKKGSELYKQVADIARTLGYTRVIGSVVPSTPQSTRMMQVMLGMGFKLLACEENIIYLSKEI